MYINGPLTRSHHGRWLQQVLVLYSKVVQRLILQHRQIGRNVRASLSSEFEVDGIHRRIHCERVLVGHISWTNRVPSCIATCTRRRCTLRTQIICRLLNRCIRTSRILKCK